MIGKLGFKAAVTVKDTVAKKIEEERRRKGEKSPQSKSPQSSTAKGINNARAVAHAMNEAEASGRPKEGISEAYFSDDETTSYTR